MGIETVLNTQQQTEILTAPGELVRTGEAVVFLPQMETAVPVRSRSWILGFLLAAALGALGGLVAAFVINGDAQRFRQSPPTAPQVSNLNAPLAGIVIPPVARTEVTVDVPLLSRPRKAGLTAVVAEKNGEVNRLKTRNRRLEALVRVLRQRARPENASPVRN